MTRNATARTVGIVGVLALGALLAANSNLRASPENASALWIGDQATLKKFSPTGEPLLSVTVGSPITSVTVDPRSGAVWVGHLGALGKYAFDGERLFARGLPSAQTDVLVAMDPERGRPWVAHGRALWALEADGAERFQIPLTRQIVSIAYNASTGEVWVATTDSVTVFSDAGAEVETLTPFSELEGAVLAVAPDDGGVWIAAGNRLAKYDSARQRLLDVTMSHNVRDAAVGADAGTLWVTQLHELVALSADGSPRVSARPFPSRDPQPRHVAADGAGGVWVASGKQAVLVRATGQVVGARLALQHVRAMDYFPDADAVPPTLEIVYPGDGVCIPRDAPTMKLIYSDVGSGVRRESLDVRLDGQDVTGACAPTSDGSECPLSGVIALTQGAHAVVARIEDREGNGTEAASEFVVDTHAPAAPEGSRIRAERTGDPEARLVRGDAFSVEAEVTVIVRNLRTGGVASVKASSAGEFSLTIGARLGDELSLVASDCAGNESAAVSVRIENPAPSLTSIEPNQAVQGSPGFTLTLHGTDFVPETFATLGGAALPTSYVSAAVLAAEVPASALVTAGTVPVEVTSPAPGGGPSNALSLTIQSSGSALRALTLTPSAAVLTPGETVRFSLRATFTDGSSSDVTALAQWGTSDPAVVTVQTGDARGVAVGLARVTAAFRGAAAAAPIEVSDGTVPQDPSVVAPAVDRTVPTRLGESTAFLYTGENPIQGGVAPGTIDPQRVAVLRGRVVTRDGEPIAGVLIRILDHPEYGTTRTRRDGMFDMTVNGGGNLRVSYEKGALLPVERVIRPNWQQYAWLPDVVMIGYDAAVTTIDLTAAVPMQVAQGSTVTDAQGTRRATLLFPQGTTATMVMPNGTTQALATLSVRATEYTVGANGPEAMPAPLPLTSGYTYAVELSADEALGAQELRFSQPLANYTENFLGFPVGGIVPSGYFDRSRGTWVASDNGRVVKVLSVSAGLAELDIEGAGTPASPAALAALGVTDAERQRLATLYAIGDSLWRVPITHFTPWDHNWPFGPPDDAKPPGEEEPESEEEEEEESDCEEGSLIECQNMSVIEGIGIVGTPFTLSHQSSRTPGRTTANTIVGSLSGPQVPASLKEIEVEIVVAGRREVRRQAAAAGASLRFEWDGKDAYGRTVQGAQPALVRIGYVYDGVYRSPAAFAQSFGVAGGAAITGSRTRREITLSREFTIGVGAWDARAQGVGGWSLDVQHAYDPAGRALYLGNGRLRRDRSRAGAGVVSTIAGNGVPGFSGDGGPAGEARLSFPWEIAAAPDGGILVVDSGTGRIRRVGPDGIISTVAGNGGFGYNGDGVPATQATLCNPWAVDAAPDGTFYIADHCNHRIRRVGLDGIISTVVGTGLAGYSGDGGLATAAQIRNPADVAVGPDGSVYVAEWGNNRVRRVGPDGIITTFAGNGTYGYSGDGGPAVAAQLAGPGGVAVGLDGSIYIGDNGNSVVRRVTSDGAISTVAGNGSAGFSGDGGPAAQAQLSGPWIVSVARDGSFYIADTGNSRVRRVSTDGIISTVAGSGGFGFSGDGGPATAATFRTPYAVAVGQDGSLFITDYGNHRVRRVAPSLPGLQVGDAALASRDGSEVYLFDSRSKLLRTVNALTGATRYAFNYNGSGLLESIVDGDGNTTQIERSGLGDATAIVAPGGQRTSLTVDSNGYLSSVAAPGGNTHHVMHAPNGLMDLFADPKGNAHPMTYDDKGRLLRDENSASGFWALSQARSGKTRTVTLTSALGRKQTYLLEKMPGGSRRRVNTDAAGLVTTKFFGADGSRSTTWSDGTEMHLTRLADPRWGMQAPGVGSFTVRSPAGLSSTLTSSRSAILADAGNPFSLKTLTETRTLNGRTAVSVFDAATREHTFTSPAGRKSTTLLDQQGRALNQRLDGLFPIQTQYDIKGRLVRTQHGPREVVIAYDAKGRPSTLSSASQSVQIEYDDADRVTRQRLPGDRDIAFSYDRNGNLTSVSPPGRPPYVFGYTPLNLLESSAVPDVGSGPAVTTYRYTVDKRPSTVTKPDGRTVGFTYDDAGRLQKMITAEGAITHAYDPATGMPRTIAMSDGALLSFTHDGTLPTTMTWTGPINGTVGWTYDNEFRLSVESVNGSHAVGRAYDPDSLLTRVGELAIERDPQNGQVTATTLGGVSDSLQYNGHGELEAYTALFGTTELLHVQYDRDDAGRVIRRAERFFGVPRVLDYGYDTADRLATVKVEGVAVTTYEYDPNGNRLAVTGGTGSAIATYNSRDQIVTYGGTSYTFSPNGTMATRTEMSGTTAYQFDATGLLRVVTLPNGKQVEYVIDGQGRRVGKKVDGSLVQRWLYGWNGQILAELDDAGDVIARFVYGEKLMVPEYMVRSGNTYRIVTDHLGSVRLVVDVVTGLVAQAIDYTEFGEIFSDSNPGFQPFAFTGREWDPETKLYYYRARYYDPKTGRFISQDPIGLAGGVNLYTYVGNSPQGFVDPFGLTGITSQQAAVNNAIATGNVGELQALIQSGALAGPLAVKAGAALQAIFGKIVGWGKDQGAEAVRQTLERVRSLNTEAVREMMRKGLDKQWVQDQLKMYNDWLAKGGDPTKNTQLLARKELMEKILELWDDACLLI